MLFKIVNRMIFVSLFFLNSTYFCAAQNNSIFNVRKNSNTYYHPKPFRYSSLSLGIGSSHYLGDISPNNIIAALSTGIRWNIDIAYSYTLSKKIQIGANISYTRLAGDDNHADNNQDYIRNLNFRNDLKQISLFFQYHPLSYSSDFRKRLFISPYIMAGVGYYFHNPETRLPNGLGRAWVNLEPLHTEGQGLNPIYPEPYKLSGFTVPIGVGLRYRYSNKVDLSFELSYHIVFTDYLDDVSGLYPNPLLISDKTGVLLTNRSREPISAGTGEDRTNRIVNYLLEKKSPITQPFDTSDSAFGAIGTSRGSKIGNDSFLTTSLKIHFIIPDGTIKCPKIN